MNISDQNIEMDINGIVSSSESYSSKINGLSLDSINMSSFEALSKFGIGKEYFKDLGLSINQLKSSSTELSQMIVAMVNQHQSIDESNSNSNFNNRYNSNNSSGGRVGGGEVGENYSSPVEMDLNEKFSGAIKEMSFEQTKALFLSLLSSPSKLNELLHLENNASILKQVLLSDTNIPNELKEIITNLDDKDLQKQLIEYFSRFKMEEKNKEIIEKAVDINVRKVSLNNVLKDYDLINNSKDKNKYLLEIYDGNNTEINKETFNIIKIFLNELASEQKTDVETLLLNSQYNDFVNIKLSNLYNTIFLYNVQQKVVV